MRTRALTAGLVAVIACGLVSQGCLVPWAKHQDLKRKYEEAVRELERKDTQLADANTRLDQMMIQLKNKDQLIKLYEDQKKEAVNVASATRTELDKVQKKIDDIAKTHGEGVEAVGGGLIIKDELLFPLGSADVSEKGQKVLEDVATKFKGSDEIIQIDGHTDDIRVAKPETIQRYGDNWGLSAMRARAVLLLLAKYGVPEKRLYLRAFSMNRERSPNTSAENRAKNRRVEVSFFPAQFIAPKPAEPPKPKEGT